MAAPYHANATDVLSGAPSITPHTPNMHDNVTSGDVHSLVERGSNHQSFQSNIVGVSFFGDDIVNSTAQNDASSPRTDIMSGGTPSFTSHNQNHHAAGTTAANTQSEFSTDKQS
eukprot:scaffold256_cov57-Attheya_sp.AAC.4